MCTARCLFLLAAVDAIDSNFRCRQFDFGRVRWKGSDERHQFFILTVTVCAITGTVFQWQLNARYNISTSAVLAPSIRRCRLDDLHGMS